MKRTWLFQPKTYYNNDQAPIHTLSDHMLESSAYLSRGAIRSSNQQIPHSQSLSECVVQTLEIINGETDIPGAVMRARWNGRTQVKEGYPEEDG